MHQKAKASEGVDYAQKSQDNMIKTCHGSHETSVVSECVDCVCVQEDGGRRQGYPLHLVHLQWWHKLKP